MFTAIKKWLCKVHYIHYLEKMGWTYLLEAEIEEKKELSENYRRRDMIVEDSEAKLIALEENKKLLNEKTGDEYAQVREEIDTLSKELDSNRVAKEQFDTRIIAENKRSIDTKRQSGLNELAKAQACRRAKI